MYNLNWTQAQQAMREGYRVKNRHFSSEEWFVVNDGHIVDEEGYHMDGWYKGYDWQDEGWMVLEEPAYEWKEDEVRIIGASTGKEHQNMRSVVLCDNFSAFEDKIIASYVAEGYDLETMDYFVGITPRSPTIPREKENYNYRITKGRGHNKLQKRKKK